LALGRVISKLVERASHIPYARYTPRCPTRRAFQEEFHSAQLIFLFLFFIFLVVERLIRPFSSAQNRSKVANPRC
jgi:hypothetical protein